MFGVKRGRCYAYPKCYRFMPGNFKMNGCAMKGMAAVQCQRCGHDNMQHEDLGQWHEGEPNLLDEHGAAWKFVNGIDGVRKVRM